MAKPVGYTLSLARGDGAARISARSGHGDANGDTPSETAAGDLDNTKRAGRGGRPVTWVGHARTVPSQLTHSRGTHPVRTCL